MENNPVAQISAEIESNAEATHVGMLRLRSANRTGKSIYAVQMADESARLRNVL